MLISCLEDHQATRLLVVHRMRNPVSITLTKSVSVQDAYRLAQDPLSHSNKHNPVGLGPKKMGKILLLSSIVLKLATCPSPSQPLSQASAVLFPLLQSHQLQLQLAMVQAVPLQSNPPSPINSHLSKVSTQDFFEICFGL